jgi:hypothetical protein
VKNPPTSHINELRLIAVSAVELEKRPLVPETGLAAAETGRVRLNTPTGGIIEPDRRAIMIG